MSIRALLKGVETRLRSADVFNDQPDEAVGKYFGIHPAPGRPPAFSGQWYAAIYWGGGRQRDKNPQKHDVFHGVSITLTARLNYAPRDRQGQRLTTVSDIYDLVDQIAQPNVIHGNWATITYANQFIVGTQVYVDVNGGSRTVDGFVETLVLESFGPERLAPGDWLKEGAAKDVYVIDLRFVDARRLQANY